jgi:hypothetical protein
MHHSWCHESVPVYRSTYFWFRKSYAPGASGIGKKGHPGCRVRNFSILTQKLFFGKHLKECVAISYFQWPVNCKQKNGVNSLASIFTMVQATSHP